VKQKSFIREMVKSVFDEMLNQAGSEYVPKPEAVMEEVNKRLAVYVSLLPTNKHRRINLVRTSPSTEYRDAYHYAVDLFLDCLMPKKKGPPTYPPEVIEQLRELHSHGKSYGELAKKIGLPITPQEEYVKSKDRVRQLIKRSKVAKPSQASKRQ
jgi:hypothetical protein